MNPLNRPPGLALALMAALGVAASVPTHAAAIISSTVGNGSFETPQLNSGTFTYTPDSSAVWTFDNRNDAGISHPPSPFGATPAPDGVQYALIQAGTNNAGAVNGYFYQPITLTAGTTYDYSFQVAGRPVSGGADGNTSDVFGFLNNSGTVLSTPLPILAFNTTSGSGLLSDFTTYSGSYTATTGGTFNIGFINTSAATAGNDHTAFIDNVNLSAAPEPAQVCTLGFFGLGLLGLALRARKRGQNSL